ncbi:hypothetical protein HOP50_20g86200 [Chloropicon primus]|nr:hypothetical protein HOP50_20g86200 [Chloropicon primus]
MATAMAGKGEKDESLAKFEAFLQVATDEMPMQELKDQVKQGLTRRYEKPPVEVIEQVLRKRMDEDAARRVLFYPDDEDASLYPLLLQNPPPGAPVDHHCIKSQIIFLGPLYLAHRRQWSFNRCFILAGGLKALVNMFLHDNLHLRGQAIEVFRDYTSEETFPWHDYHKLQAQQGGAKTEQANVVRRMFELSEAGIIQKLVANYDNAFPGASHLCLGVLAFYSSFLRVNFCKDNILQFSQNLLDKLRAWSTRTDASQEERDLAKRLHEDFGRFDAAKLPEQAKASSRPGQEEEDFMLYEVKEGFDRTSVNHVGEAGGQQEQWKAKGNAAYKAKDYNLAVDCYSKALDVPVTEEQLLTEGPRRAVLHSNRAAAYLARSKVETGATTTAVDDDAGQLAGCDLVGLSIEERKKMNCKAALLDCDQALDLQSGNVKARYRKAQALKGLGRMREALDAARSALNVAPKALEREIRAFLESVSGTKSASEAASEVASEVASKASLSETKTEAASWEQGGLLDSIVMGGSEGATPRWPSNIDDAAVGDQSKAKKPLIQVISEVNYDDDSSSNNNNNS